MPSRPNRAEDALLFLARDRPNSTPELHTSNDFYGYARLLKGWAGWRASRPLPAALEHGLPLQEEIWEADRRSSLPTLLCATADRAAAYAAASPGRVGVPIGPPIAYARQPREPLAPPILPGAPLLAFPAHSTHHVQARFDMESFARRLAGLRSDWPDVRVCLYWRDVLDGAAEVYRREGLECVCAGHIYDPSFLPRLRRLLLEAGGVVTNEMGTHVFYAVLCGRPVWIAEHPATYVERQATSLERDFMTSPLTGEAAAMFAHGPRAAPSVEQLAFVNSVSGVAHVREPAELAELLVEARRRYSDATGAADRMVARARARARWTVDALRARLT